MALQANDTVVTDEDYLKGELESEIKHEYVNGQVYAMIGGTPNHARISGNIFVIIHNFLNGKKCEAFISDIKVKTPSNSYRYPDVVVVCSDLKKSYTDLPVILVEVLSRSTRRTDSVTKKLEYFNIPTLKEYVLIEQDFVDVEVFRQDNNWKSDHYFLGEDVCFTSIGLTLSVEEIYDRVDNEDMQEYLRKKGGK